MIRSKHIEQNHPTTVVATPPEVSLLERYPHEERFRLTDGTVVSLPVHQVRFDFLVLSGDANLPALNQILAPEGLEAAPHSTDDGNRGEVQLYAIEYKAGDAGSYLEMFEVFSVRELTKSLPAKKWPQYFVRQVRVPGDQSGTLPLRFGREVWGYPKQPGTTTLSIDSKIASFSYVEPGETDCSFRGSCAVPTLTTLPTTKFEFVTPYAIRRSYATIINRGQLATKSYSAGTSGAADQFEVKTNTALGRELQGIGFAPTNWFVCRDFEAVAFTSAEPAVVTGLSATTAVAAKDRYRGGDVHLPDRTG